jgi:hypothetical protein
MATGGSAATMTLCELNRTTMNSPANCEERRRLDLALPDVAGFEPWRKWGAYLSERQWGTVREDYSADGDPWLYLTHDVARSHAYRWGEDGLAGICDDQQRLCLALALWNGRDPILKERFFGLSNHEGNHGEDAKEQYYYLDATPTHSYLKMLYKYPQREFPYARLVEENARRGKRDPEFELLDTGVFADDRYFDVLVEYAKATPIDVLMRITVCNRGPEPAEIHVLPQLWFRNTWSWKPDVKRPLIDRAGPNVIEAHRRAPGNALLYAEGSPKLLFTDNDTNARRLFGMRDAQGYFKDAFHDFVVRGDASAVNPQEHGTKAAAYYRLTVPAGGETQLRLILAGSQKAPTFDDFNRMFDTRIAEADAFYADLQSGMTDADARNVQRQALAGMQWNKQFYHFDVPRWLSGDQGQPPPPGDHRNGRNRDWKNLVTADVLSMPDKWEYPWFAAWDLAFHCIPLAMVDPDFAKQQLVLLMREWYMHPNGQLPAYEWNFSDVNPPVHAWAAWQIYALERDQRGGHGDLEFLERVFHKLMLNFTWWVNRKDVDGRNLFQGGFLGLDNIGVFDRSKPLPFGGWLDQADGTAWMAMYCLNLLRIALELAAEHDHVYEDIASKFFEHFLEIAEALENVGGDGNGVGLWNEEDQFYYDAIRLPNGAPHPIKVRSIVGLIPLFAVETIEPETLAKLPGFGGRLEWFLKHRPDLAGLVSHWEAPGLGRRRLLSLLRGHRMKRLLMRALDETEFLSDYGIRSLSRYYSDHPYVTHCGDSELTVDYEPGDSTTSMFGGNSNWRGPIWFPINYLIIESLRKFHHYYSDDFKVECPTGSKQFLTLNGIADELTRRLTRLFLRDAAGRRPAFGADDKLQTDPHFRDHLLFYEFFHGDTGRGLGAAHQTGWTGLVAKLLQPANSKLT